MFVCVSVYCAHWSGCHRLQLQTWLNWVVVVAAGDRWKMLCSNAKAKASTPFYPGCTSSELILGRAGDLNFEWQWQLTDKILSIWTLFFPPSFWEVLTSFRWSSSDDDSFSCFLTDPDWTLFLLSFLCSLLFGDDENDAAVAAFLLFFFVFCYSHFCQFLHLQPSASTTDTDTAIVLR